MNQFKGDRLWAGATAVTALVAFFLCVRLSPYLTTASSTAVVFRSAILILTTVALLIITSRLRFVDNATMGLQWRGWRTIAWGIGCGLLTLVTSAVAIAVMQRIGGNVNTTMLAALASRPAPLIALIALTASISEEIIFRSILISHFETALGSRWLAAALSLILFAGAHFTGWGLSQVVLTMIPGLILTAFFLWKRDLGLCMIAHFSVDLLGLLSASAGQQHHA